MISCFSLHKVGMLFVFTVAFVSPSSCAFVIPIAVNNSTLACAGSNANDCQIVTRDGQDDSEHPPFPLRGLSTHFDAEFNTLPQGGWSTWTVENGGLEWLWASPVAVTEHYYEAFPSHVNQNLTCNDDRFSADNFPRSVQLSGFRLPTASEVHRSKPLLPPICMARYVNNGAHWCDEHDYVTNALVTSDESCSSGCCDTLYVRPVGTSDVDFGRLLGNSTGGGGDKSFPCYGIGDSDGDGVCNDVDNCIRTPNPLQGYAFLVSPLQGPSSCSFLCLWHKRLTPNHCFQNMDASCADVSIELNNDGIAILGPDDLHNGASDACSVAELTGGKTEFDCSNVGRTIMDYFSLVDNNGNNGSCITNITVRDSVVSTMYSSWFTYCMQ
jgi:hypothetical protein